MRLKKPMFATLIDVDGPLLSWGTDGVKGVRYYKKDLMLGVDIGIREEEWRGKSIEELRELIALRLHTGFALMIKRIKKEKWDFDEQAFLSHTNSVLETFLSDIGEYSASRGELEVREKLQIMVECKRLATILGEPYTTVLPGAEKFLQTPP